MSDVIPVPLPEALKISLNNYYDLLKAQVGGLGADEFIQLKVVADPVDVDDEKYRFYSLYQLLVRSDLAIEPSPVAGSVLTSADTLALVYGRFLQRIRNSVVRTELEEADQLAIADLDQKLARNRDKRRDLAYLEIKDWNDWCEVMGTERGDRSAYFQWSVQYGRSAEIQTLYREYEQFLFDKNTILNKEYADPEDREIVKAEVEFDSVQMRLRYPINPDYMYDGYQAWTLNTLASLAPGSTALFDDRRALTWNVAVDRMKTIVAGSFNATWDRTTGESNSITTDWGAGGSVSYGPFSASADASEHRQIQEDFKKTTKIMLGAKAAYKTQLIYPGWFRPTLFNHKRLRENLRDYEDFFGPRGSLRYYPTHLIIVRGFSTGFESSQAWTYDYERKFSASGGGGFSVFGIKLGGKASYGSHVKEHKIDKQNTTLTMSDDDSTLRFVGYVVKENTIWEGAPGPGGRGRKSIFRSPVDLPGDAATARQSSTD